MTGSLRLFSGVALLLLLSLLIVAGMEAGSTPAPPVDLLPPGTLGVVLSGELNGHITPCGCSKPMLGGLPRRAAYLEALGAKERLVRVENGDLTEALGRQDEIKAETVVEMLSLLQYDAINLGEKDFRQGVPFLQSLQARFKGALLCANARKADGSSLFKERANIQRTVAGRPVRVTIIGLLSNQFAEEVHLLAPDVQLEDPTATLERLQAGMSAISDVRILLYHGPRAEAEDLVRRFGQFQLVLYAHEGDHSAEPARVQASSLVGSGQDGKYISLAQLKRDMGWQAGGVKSRALDPGFTDNAPVLALKRAYLDRVISEDLLAQVPKSPTVNDDTYAGSAACANCHKAANGVWYASSHARALKTLLDEKHDRDPECVGCHVVGLDRASGFVSHAKTPHLENVGCESCHGPAAKHVQNSAMKPPRAGESSCQACHVPQHSPNFDFSKYWAKIKH